MTITRDALDGMDFSDVAMPGMLDPVTPGEILREDFMVPLALSARALARHLDVPANRITGILNGERSITAETAILLARHFGNSPRFWMNLQVSYDLAMAERHHAHAA
jgi:addiction module HigA family antidote